MQLHHIAAQLALHRPEIEAAPDENSRRLEMVYANYRMIDDYIRTIVRECPYEGKTVLTGGLLINTPSTRHDRFIPMTMQLHYKNRVRDILHLL
jgi:hypothetical protein